MERGKDGGMQRWLEDAAAGGGRGIRGEDEINQQAIPTVHRLWGVETCIYVAD